MSGMFGKLKELSTQKDQQKPGTMDAPVSDPPQKHPVSDAVVPQERSEQPRPTTSLNPSKTVPPQPHMQRNTSGAEPLHGHTLQSAATAPLAQSTGQPVDRSISQPINQSTGQSTNQSTTQSTHLPSTRIVSRPKAFYITERLNARLDDAVKYLQEQHGIRKVDRSTVVNALLDNEDNWTEASLDLLVSRVLSLLTSRLTS